MNPPIHTPDHDLVDAFLNDHLAELIAFRRALHAHPELSWQEFETTERIAERLRVAGLEPRVLSSGTGLICDIGPSEGPVVAVRADIDALAMDDEKDVPYRSQVRGVAHACGHDVHTTVALGVGLAWANHHVRRGRLRLLFEPAEEQVPGGALQVIADGGLEDVVAVFAVHCDPHVDAGAVALRAGPISSAADSVEIELTGPGGHTARPQETVDLVRVAGQLADRLPDLVAQRAAEWGHLLCVFGAIHSGDASNVIPTTARLGGSVRTPEREVWKRAEEIVESCAAELLRDTGARWDVTYRSGVPPVENDPAATELARDAAARALGAARVGEAARSVGGDTYAWYLEEAPGTYIRLGVHGPDGEGPRHDLHAGSFDVDERSIATGIRVLLASALAASD